LKRHPGSVIGLDFPPVVFLCPDCVPKSGSILDGIPVSPEVRVMLRKYGFRLHQHGESPGRVTKDLTHRKERREKREAERKALRH